MSRLHIYLDEAVVEVEPEQGRRHAGLPGDGRRHYGPDDVHSMGARVVVELRDQGEPAAAAPRVAAGGAGEDDGAEHDE
jgi:hypothetical protein